MSTHALPSFDTLQYVKRLKAADVPEKQAEAQAEALREALADQFATQSDVSLRVVTESETSTRTALVALEKKMDERFGSFEKTVDERFFKLEKKMDERFAKVDTGFAEVRGDIRLLKWMMGTLIAGVMALILKAYF